MSDGAFPSRERPPPLRVPKTLCGESSRARSGVGDNLAARSSADKMATSRRIARPPARTCRALLALLGAMTCGVVRRTIAEERADYAAGHKRLIPFV